MAAAMPAESAVLPALLRGAAAIASPKAAAEAASVRICQSSTRLISVLLENST